MTMWLRTKRTGRAHWQNSREPRERWGMPRRLRPGGAGWLAALLAGTLLAGCATSSVTTRKQERQTAYNSLPPDQQRLVDRGQVKLGMSQDAVYIAWGAPAQVLEEETAAARTTTWLYHGQWMEETRFWTYREISRDGTMFLERYLERDYNPRGYVRAEIVFVDGKAARWRTLPRPLQ
jgi:hypothetical protein